MDTEVCISPLSGFLYLSMTGKRRLTATTDARRLLELAAISVRCAFAQRFMSLWLGERFERFDILAGSTVVLTGLRSTRRCPSRSDMSSLSKVDHMRDLNWSRSAQYCRDGSEMQWHSIKRNDRCERLSTEQ